MAELFFADLVRETSHGAGTGALALGGAVAGHRRFADAVPAGATFHYAIAGVTHPGQWETGEGRLSPEGALLRTPLASSDGGAAVDFLEGAKTVTLTVASAWFDGIEAKLDGKAGISGAAFSGGLSAPTLALGAPLSVEHGGTGAASAAAARDRLGLVIGTDVAAFDPTLDALSALDVGQGLVEQTGPDSFAKRAIGTAAAASIPTRGDADARYAPSSHGHGIGEVTGLQSALDSKQPGDAELTALAGLTSAADRLPYFTGAGTAALATFTASGRTVAAASGVTGTGNVAFSASPTFTGTAAFAALSATGTISSTAAELFRVSNNAPYWLFLPNGWAGGSFGIQAGLTAGFGLGGDYVHFFAPAGKRYAFLINLVEEFGITASGVFVSALHFSTLPGNHADDAAAAAAGVAVGQVYRNGSALMVRVS